VAKNDFVECPVAKIPFSKCKTSVQNGGATAQRRGSGRSSAAQQMSFTGFYQVLNFML
jgi:hypothetical protein